MSLYREEGEVYAANLRDYTGFSVEDLLTATELFSTPPYSVEVELLRKRYRELIAKASRSDDEDAEVIELGRKLSGFRIGSSRRAPASIQASRNE